MVKACFLSIVLAAALLLPGLSHSAGAPQGASGEPPAAAEEPHAAPKTPDAYVPGLGDFMTAYVQPHHIKLWLAGSQGHWPLADYEAKELRETFEDVVAYHAAWNQVPVAEYVETLLTPRLTAVDQAIAGRSEARFKQAYEGLTGACNACHQAAQHGFIVIQVPAAGAFPDQKF